MAKSWSEIKREKGYGIQSSQADIKTKSKSWQDIKKEKGYISPEPIKKETSWSGTPVKAAAENVRAGWNQFGRVLPDTIDMLLGDKNIKVVDNYLADQRRQQQEEAEKLARINETPVQQFAGSVFQGIGQSAPYAVSGILTAPYSASMEAGKLLTAGGTQLAANTSQLLNPTLGIMAKQGLKEVVRNPNSLLPVISGVSNQFKGAIDKGATRDEAIKSAIIGGIPSGLVESMGGLENISGKLSSKMTIGKLAFESAFEEFLEEVIQYPVENLADKAVFDKNMPYFSLNGEAVINPKEQLYAGASAFVSSGLSGGATGAVNAVMQKNYSKQIDKLYKNTINNLPENSPILARVKDMQDKGANITDETKLWVINSAGNTFESETEKILQTDGQKETFISNDNIQDKQSVKQEQPFVKTQNIASQAVNPVLSAFNIQNINNAREVKQSIYEFYKNSIISDSNTSKPILNKSSGTNVEVSRATINQTFQADEKYAKNQDNEIKINAMANVVDLIQNGEFAVVDESDTPSSKVKYAEISGTVNVNGTPYEITMDVRRTDNGKKLFVHSLSTSNQQVINSSVNKKSGVIYNGTDEKVKQQYPKVYDILDRIGKATNTKFKFVETIYDPSGQEAGFANGQYDPSTDSIEIALDTFNPFMVVAKHEITHMLEKENPKLYREYKDYVLSAMKENGTYDREFGRMAALYESRGLSIDKNAIEDELVADATELFLTDANAINNLVAENKTLGQKILDVLRKLIEKIEDILEVSGFSEGWLNTEQLREAERLWVNALSDVAENSIIRNNDKNSDAKNSLKVYNVNEIENMILTNHSEYKKNKEALKLAGEAIKDLQKVKFSISATGREVDRGKSGIRTIADGISREFINKGYIELKGRKIKNLEELAVLAQVFRDPRFETFRIFYTKNNKIVAHEAISSRIPGMSGAFLNVPKRKDFIDDFDFQMARDNWRNTKFDDMKVRMKRLKADGYYLLHNHPSGNPDASNADVRLTKDFMDNVSGFKGHVIINSNKYGWLDMGQYSYSVHVEDMMQQQMELFLKPTIDHPLLNEKIDGADKVASIVKSLQKSDDKTTIIYADVKGIIRGIEEIPNGMFNDGKSIRGFLRNRGKHFGSGWAFLGTTSQEIFGKSTNLVKEKYLMDSVVLIGNDSLSHRADMGTTQDNAYAWAGIKNDNFESTRVNEEQKHSLKNEVFYTPNKVEVIKNPTDKQLEQLRADFKKEYPKLAKQGEPPTRRTYDVDGNVYYWKSTDGLHYNIEYYIDKKYNTQTEQNKYFDIKYNLKPRVENSDYKDIITVRDDGKISFKKDTELPKNIWSKIHTRFRRLGYMLHDVDDTKRYILKGNPLNLDQSKAVIDVLGLTEKTEQGIAVEKAKKYATKAARHFGTTNNFKLAGYLTINGSLLDFSEGQGYRVQDHREIQDILDFIPDGAPISQGMIEFMNQGNIRLQSYGIDISVKPNSKQRLVLRKFFDNLNGEAVVDFSREDGGNAGSVEYPEGTRNDRILRDIDKFFDTGELPQISDVQRFRYSLKDSQGRAITQEQAEYFKDSKVRDSKGNLLALYHGTFNEFYTFTKGDIGYHFGTKKAAEDRIKTRRGVTADYDNSEIYMMPVYLNISNPMTLPDTGAWRPIDIIKALEVEADYNNSPLTKKELQTELNRYFDAIDDKGFDKATSEWYENFKNRLITEHGIDGIKYKNKFEDKGEYSYIAFSPEQIKSVDNLEPSYNEDIRYSLRTKEPPKKTIKAYKLLRIDRKTGKLYPLFVGAKEETPTGVWLDADDNQMVVDERGRRRVASKTGESTLLQDGTKKTTMAYRPGWHLGDIPLATHIGVKGDSGKIEFMNPDHVWAEVDVAADVNYQEEANRNGTSPKTGKINPRDADIKRIPVDGYYRYKTNPNMTGEWIITGAIKINRVLSDSEAAKIAREAGHEPLPRAGSDVKYQLRDSKTQKDIDKLQNTVTRLKEQFKLTKGVKLDEKSVRRLSKTILKDYGSKHSSTELETKLYNVYMGMVNGGMEYDEAQTIITEAARDIIENASVLNDAMYKQYSNLRNTMRNTAITIDDKYKGDFDAVGGWNDFRKKNFGRMNISNDGMSIDSLYQELSDSYPELFVKDIANPADQLMLISDVLDNFVPIYENPYNRNLNEAVEYLALEIFDGMTSVPEAKPTFADKKKAEKQKAVENEKDKSKARIEAIKGKNADDVAWLKYQNKEKLAEVLRKEKAKRDIAVAKVKEQYQGDAYKTWWKNKLKENDIKSHYQEMMAELRANRDEKLENQKTKYKERISGIYEDRKIRQAKDRIRAMTKKLSKMLRNPTQKQHIPKALDKTIAELLAMLDFTTDKQNENTQLRLRDLRAEFEKIAKVSDEDGLSATADPYIVEALEMLHGKRIADMSLQEIEVLRDIVSYFENMVRTYNKAFLNGKWVDIVGKSEGIINDLETDTPMNDSAYGGILYFKDMMNWGMLTPQMFFERMGNTFNGLYDDFRAALDVKINNTKIAQDYMSNLLADSKDKVKEWTGKKAEIKSIKLDSGATIELTQSQLMSFYLLMKREQARGHIFGLGVKAAPIVAVNNKGIKYVKKQFEPVKITLNDAARMIAALNKEQRRIADGIGKFMNTYSKQWVNEATLQNYGYELAKEENYFPIKVDKDFLKSDFDNTNLDPTFTSMGFLKATVKGAGNAIILEDVFDVFTEHADKAATYNAFIGITESTKKIINYKTENDSIKQAMNKKFGIQAFNYLKKFMVDLQGGIRTEGGSPVVSSLIRSSKRAVLGLNLRTIIQQPTAIVRASALIDVDYLIKGVAMKSDKAEMLEKSPIARWKSWGYFNLDTGRSMKDIILDTVPLLDKQYEGMQIADDITWTKIWNAVKLEIEDTEPELKVGSTDYFDAVNYRFNEIIDRTQVVDTVMHRSDSMRQSDSSWKMLTAFMSEPTKSYNLLLNAVEKYNADKSVENKRALIRTFSAWTATMLVNTLIVSMVDMWRKKEDDNEAFKDKWFSNIINDVTGYVPIVRDIYSLFEGYSVKRMEYNGIERIVRAINRSKKYVTEMAEGEKHSYPLRLITKDWIESIAYVFGIGAINVSKDLQALLKNYTKWIDDEGVVNDIYEFMFKK